MAKTTPTNFRCDGCRAIGQGVQLTDGAGHTTQIILPAKWQQSQLLLASRSAVEFSLVSFCCPDCIAKGNVR